MKHLMKLMVIENHKDISEVTFYYDAVLVEVKWIDEAGWYCYVIHCEDGSTATFTCGESAVFQWSDINKRYKVI